MGATVLMPKTHLESPGHRLYFLHKHSLPPRHRLVVLCSTLLYSSTPEVPNLLGTRHVSFCDALLQSTVIILEKQDFNSIFGDGIFELLTSGSGLSLKVSMNTKGF